MQLRNPLLLTAALLLLAGCGASSQPGTGTKTLFVDATSQSDGSSGGTSVVVLVRSGSSGGEFVSDAAVTIISDKGTEYVLPWAGIFGIGGYSRSSFPWEPGWKLRVVRGADQLEGYVAAPGLTTIEGPTAATAFSRSANQPLVVKWHDEGGRSASSVKINLKQAKYEQLRPEDRGGFEVPAGTITQAGSERLTITRETDVSLAGGVSGSTFKAITTAAVDFTVQ